MIKPILMTVLMALSLAGISYAQDDSIAQIQAQVNRLLEENAKLEAEYRLINNNAQSLQRAIDQHGQEAEEIEEQAQGNRRTQESCEEVMAELQRKAEELNKSIAEQREIQTRLRDESIRIDQDSKVLQKQLADIPQEREVLSKEIKFRQFALEQAQEREAIEVRDLASSLQRLEDRQRQLRDSLKNVPSVPSSQEEIKQIKEENKALQRQIKALKKEIKVKTKANARLKQKTSAVSKSAADEMWQKEKERVVLSQDVEQLQAQVDALNQNVDSYLADQAKREKLLQQIMQLTEETEALRQKISPAP